MFYSQILYSLLSLDVCHEVQAHILFLTYSKNRSLLGEEQITRMQSSQEWKAGPLFVFLCLCLEVATCVVP